MRRNPWWVDVQLEVKGVRECQRYFQKVRRELGPEGLAEYKTEAVESAVLIRDWMRSFVHPVTGRLERAIQSGPYGPGVMAAFIRVDYKIAPHAHLVEYGTVKMAAKPYFRRGLEVGSGLVLMNLMRKLERLVEAAERRAAA